MVSLRSVGIGVGVAALAAILVLWVLRLVVGVAILFFKVGGALLAVAVLAYIALQFWSGWQRAA